MNTDRPKIRTEHLLAGYEKNIVLDDISFSVREGEILVLIGPNGAGKSTLLRTLVRELKPLGGCVYMDEKPVSELSGNDIAKKMSILMTGGMDPELMTCGDVVQTGRYPYTGTFGILSPADIRIAEESMKAVSVFDLKDRSFRGISDGQRQRVLLARAICQEPEILILDEPTSYLDIRYRLELLHMLKKLVLERKLTVIMSLHELEMAERIADRIICVKDGRADRMGTPAEIFGDDYIKRLYGFGDDTYDEILKELHLIRRSGKTNGE